MMKKNLFLLFSVYFFVLQPIILGFLRGEIKFFYLSVINFIFIIIIFLLSKEKKEKKEDNLEKKVEKLEKINYIQKNNSSKKISHVWFFVISVLFGFFLWFWLPEMFLYLQLLSVVIGSYLLFVVFGLLFKFKITKTWESKIYMLLLIVLFIWSILRFLNINVDNFVDIQEEQLNSTGEVSFVSVDADLTGDVVVDMESEVIDDLILLDKKLTFGDVIKYLLDKNNVDLDTKKNIKFTYVGYNDIDYPYYRTAYSLGMIGKTLNPSKNLLCETYVVMMGLVEGWSVGQYADIKKAYWDYAKENNKTPNCKYGEFISTLHLN